MIDMLAPEAPDNTIPEDEIVEVDEEFDYCEEYIPHESHGNMSCGLELPCPVHDTGPIYDISDGSLEIP